MASGLPWIRLDSDIAQNPKIAELVAEYKQRGMAASFLFVAALGYSGAHNTDGEVRKSVLPFIHGSGSLARLLVEVGLWETTPRGWQITNYAAHQPTKASLEAEAEARSSKARKAAEARWGTG